MTSRLLLTFHGDTLELLRKNPDAGGTVVYPLCRRASIKDILEGLGVPHTEVGRIILGESEQGFAKIAEDGEHYQIHPLTPALPPTMATVLRPQPLATCLFLVDINVGRLAGLLRMAGCDALLVAADSDAAGTVERAVGENRILLSRNRDLLKQRRLVFGRLVRSEDPERQLREIIDLYRLRRDLRPFSRCIACNGLLVDVAKEAVIDRLLPLTKKYFDRFKECTGCGKIYWHGSHHEKMAAKLARILGESS
jgi:uncharacterized protein